MDNKIEFLKYLGYTREVKKDLRSQAEIKKSKAEALSIIPKKLQKKLYT
jgi:hypothetical protein